MDGFKRPSRSSVGASLPPVQPLDMNGTRTTPRPAPTPTPRTAPPAPTAQCGTLPPVQPPRTAQQPAPTSDHREPVAAAPAETPQPKKSRRRRWWLVAGVAFVLLVIASVVGYLWYQAQLRPVDTASKDAQDITITSDTSFSFLSERLAERGLIRNKFAFSLYAKLEGKDGALKQGSCRITPAESAAQILDKVTTGCNDYRNVIFYPGATIEEPLYKPSHATLDQSVMSVRGALAKAGYSAADIDSALKATYDSPLFADKPSSSSLEGYVYGETYHLSQASTAKDALKESFKQMNSVIEKEGMKAKFSAHNLNLYQAITLASIVQRELNCEGKPTTERTQRCYEYQRTIAQIFLKRLATGEKLGSDVTFIYAADQMKVTPTVDLDSPYNTRRYAGLPPGPIASPGLHALLAVANPSETDYLYFIAGDDGLIYFANTEAEHNKNIKNHCQQLCSEL